jgi:sulfatase modifying factor 1
MCVFWPTLRWPPVFSSAAARAVSGATIELVNLTKVWLFSVMRRHLAAVCFALAAARLGTLRAEGPRHLPPRRCSAEMVRVQGFCIDRWEVRTVDASTGEPLSPYYPPSPKLSASVRDAWLSERATVGSLAARAFSLPALSTFQREHSYEPRAVSEAQIVPQGYLSYHLAKKACENAHKRLCSKDEWVTACRGQKDTQFPYGSDFRAGRCNIHRAIHPGYVLHASSSLGLLDPRLNLVEEGEDPLLHLTGASGSSGPCASEWPDGQVFDMVGNLDEWVEDGMFLGGFYARSTTKGCDAQVSSHAPSYFDYSTGTRCCADLPERG